MTLRLSSIYLPTSFFVAFAAIFAGPVQAVGAPLASTIYAAFVVLTAAALWSVGATTTDRGRAWGHPSFMPGVLLLSGPLVLVLGASVTGHPTGERPGYFLFNTTALLLGVLILAAGYALLSARLWRAGERLLSVLGIVGFVLGAALYAANMLFRYAVIASGAAEAFVVADRQVFPTLGSISFPPGGEPSWLAFLYIWATLMLAAYGFLSYLVSAAFGAALAKVGWIGRVGGTVVVALGLALALVMGPGWHFLSNPVVEFLLFFLGVPFMTVALPYFLGVALIRHAYREDRAVRKVVVPTEVPVSR
jgi:hypothetical protein